jgi:hypothetical protein
MKSFYSFLDQSPIDVEIICGEAHDRSIIAATLNCIVKARKNILQTAATAGDSPCFKRGPQFVVGGIIRDYDEDFQACIGGPLCAQENRRHSAYRKQGFAGQARGGRSALNENQGFHFMTAGPLQICLIAHVPLEKTGSGRGSGFRGAGKSGGAVEG